MADKKAIKRGAFLQAAGATAAGAALVSTGAGTALASSSKTPVTLEFWNPASDPTGKIIIAKVVDGFNATVGKANGIFVHNRIVPDPAGTYVKYTTAMTSSGAPDVIMTYAYDPVAGWAANGFIQPLDGYAKTAGIKQGDYFPIAWTMTNFNGHIWGLLQEFDFNQFFWNKDIHKGPPPKTIAELDALAAKYIKFDKKGNLIQAGLIPWHSGLTGYNTDWNALWGGSFYDVATAKWTINTPENRKFLDWFLKYVDMYGGRGKVDALESATPRVYGDLFLYGKVAFAPEGEYTPLEINQLGLKKLRYGVAYMPTGPGVPYGTNRTGGGNLFLLPKKSPHPKEAAIFIQYMGSTKASLEWCLGVSNLVPVKDAAHAASFNKTLPWIKPWVDALDFNHMVPPSPSPQVILWNTTIGNAIDQVTYKKKTPAQALADAESKIATAVQKFKQFHSNWSGE